MPEKLKDAFVTKLEEHYGAWEKNTSRFGNATFGKIATDLCISASQFTKLLSGNATEGMYVRSIRNVDRLIEKQQVQTQLEQVLQQLKSLQQNEQQTGTRLLVFSLLALMLGAATVYFFRPMAESSPNSLVTSSQHPLALYFDQGFDADFDSPYLKASDVQEYCPCSAYEGIWSLAEAYKLPLPGTRKPGVYYLAKSADVRMKCSKSDTFNVGKGRVLVAYEYLVNEIWVDTELTPLSPTYFDKDTKQYTPEFEALTFAGNDQFKKVATIHSFFIDKFEIHPDSIVRKGEPAGRFASDVDEALVETYEIDLKHILENVLGDLTKTDCEASLNPFCDPNDLREGESVISFDCLYTIKAENLGMGGGYPYQKGYQLREQNYSDNLTCGCD